MKSLFFFCCAFFSIIIVLELFIQNSGVGNLSISENDRQNGQVLKKNTNIIYFNEGFYIGKTNKYGYYGPDYDTIKSEGSLRIALIGDSYVEGHQVFDRNHFRCLLEKNLNDSLNKKVEVLNFGMSGFNLNDNLGIKFSSKISEFLSRGKLDPTSNKLMKCDCGVFLYIV